MKKKNATVPMFEGYYEKDELYAKKNKEMIRKDNPMLVGK